MTAGFEAQTQEPSLRLRDFFTSSTARSIWMLLLFPFNAVQYGYRYVVVVRQGQQALQVLAKTRTAKSKARAEVGGGQVEFFCPRRTGPSLSASRGSLLRRYWLLHC